MPFRFFLLSLACVMFAARHATPLAGAEGPRTERKKLVMLIAGQSYDAEQTLPVFAAHHLAGEFRIVTVTGAMVSAEHRFDRIEEVTDADVLLVSVWRRTPPQAQLDVLRAYVAAGRPVVGIATSSHAFTRRQGAPLAAGQDDWPAWGTTVIGANYAGHRSARLITAVTAADAAHPVLAGVTLPFKSPMELNQVSPLAPSARVALIGTVDGFAPEPVAWTLVRADGGRTFFTPLGHPEDFRNPSFQRLLVNGIFWAAKMIAPGASTGEPALH
jgi:type 1 glutamine amidotransferase